MNRLELQSLTLAGSLLVLATAGMCGADTPLAIGSRRELFVDRFLIERLDNVRLKLHEPRDEGEVFRFDQPWEGPFCGYSTIIKDGELFRLYYRGKQANKPDGESESTCYAESHDGIHWTRPKLGLYEVDGQKENNVVLAQTSIAHNFSPFLDTRPGVPSKERFKAVGGVLVNGAKGWLYKHPKGGLRTLGSSDGIHWEILAPHPVLTDGTLDSQNVAFWSESEGCYVAYLRTFTSVQNDGLELKVKGLRTVTRSTSPDFLHWSEAQAMRFEPPQTEQFYTSQTQPYFRAPHLYVATAARFMQGRHGVTDEEAQRLQVVPSYYKSAKDSSDSVLLTSRDGVTYQQTFREALIRPGLNSSQWISRCGYPALNVVQTSPTEMSLYVNQDYAQPTAHLHRYTWRLDGFASMNAGYDGGEFVTKPLRFTGHQLTLNCATSAAGSIRVEVQDEAGKPLAGYAAADCIEIFGNSLERTVTWKVGPDVSSLAGQIVRLRFVMKDADLFALQFGE